MKTMKKIAAIVAMVLGLGLVAITTSCGGPKWTISNEWDKEIKYTITDADKVQMDSVPANGLKVTTIPASHDIIFVVTDVVGGNPFDVLSANSKITKENGVITINK